MKRLFLIILVFSFFGLACEESETIKAPASYTTKVLIEDFTGAWCGYCPRLAYILEQVENDNKNIISVGVHYNDKMSTRYAGILKVEHLVKSFPTGLLNRSVFWDETQADLDTYLSKVSKLGLSINSIKKGNNLSVDVKVGFAEDINEDLNLVVYLTEDGILENQSNAYNVDISSPWYNAGNPIVDFKHNHVLRLALTDIFGDNIPSKSVFERNIYNRNLSIDISEYDSNNLNVVAFVIGAADRRNVYNAQMVKVGNSIDFD